MDKATLTAVSSVLDTDSEKVSYLYQDARSSVRNTQEFIIYVEGKDWTDDEKKAVMIDHGFHVCQKEEPKAKMDLIFSSIRLDHVVNHREITATDSAEAKLGHLTIVEDPLLLISEAKRLECELENYIHVGMLIACM